MTERRVLIAATAIYLASLAAFFFWIRGPVSEQLSLALLFLPIALPALALGMAWSVFMVGVATGVPLVSVSHALMLARQQWRGAIAVTLIAAVSVAWGAFVLLR